MRYVVGDLNPTVKHIQFTSDRHNLRPDATHCAVRTWWQGSLIEETSPFFALRTCRACLKSWNRQNPQKDDQQSDYLLAGEWRRARIEDIVLPRPREGPIRGPRKNRPRT